MGILRTVGTYLVLLVVLHPVLFILSGAFGILLTAPTYSFDPSILARIAPQYERSISVISWTSIVIGSLEIVFYYKIWPRLRRYVK